MTTPELDDPATIRILVADDHMLLRDALCELLHLEDDFAVCGVAGNGGEVLDVARRTSPDVVLLDLDMPGHDPARDVPRLRLAVPDAKVIVLTMHEHRETVRTLIAAGAVGFLSKAVSRQNLVTTIRSVRSGLAVTVGGGYDISRGARETELSARELEVLALVAEALSNRQIGRRLCITEGTVKRHLRNAFSKLDVTSRMAAVVRARQLGLLRPAGGFG